MFFFTTSDQMKFMFEKSPIRLVEKIEVPILLLVGKNDRRVGPSQSFELFYSLKALNKQVLDAHGVENPGCEVFLIKFLVEGPLYCSKDKNANGRGSFFSFLQRSSLKIFSFIFYLPPLLV